MSRIKAPVKSFGGFATGMIVKKFQRWGPNAGRIDDSVVYLIRQIGESGALVDRLDPATMIKYPYRRGRRERLYTIEDSTRYLERGNDILGVLNYPYSWSHVFVQVGQEGWDPDF